MKSRLKLRPSWDLPAATGDPELLLIKNLVGEKTVAFYVTKPSTVQFPDRPKMAT